MGGKTHEYSFDLKHFPSDVEGLITRVEFAGCRPGSLVCRLVKVNSGERKGVARDAWWVIESRGGKRRPARFVRLRRGAESLRRFTQNYGYSDGDGCVHFRSGRIVSGDLANIPLPEMTRFEHDAQGVPQRLKNSGMCWFAATCFASFFCTEFREVLLSKFDACLRPLCEQSLLNPDAAEALRQKLYYEYHFGDDPRQAPELDGQNGFAQLCILLQRFDIPTLRVFAPDMVRLTDPIVDQRKESHQLREEPVEGENHLICIRCFRTKYTPRRRLRYGGRTYRLVSVLIGSEHCGHQIAVSTRNMRVCRWAVADSDASRHGIGPMFFQFRREPGECMADFSRRWWDSITNSIPVTVFERSTLCDLSPENRKTGYLQKKVKEDDRAGVVNSDFIYLHIPAVHRPKG